MKYRTIVADPPWPTTTGPARGTGEHFTGGDGKSRALSYPTMSIEEICALPVRDLADEAGCALYLWTTNRYLRDAFDVLDSWRFRYSTTVVWAKALMGGGLGGTWGISTEFVLYAKRGLPTERGRMGGRIGGTWHQWKRPYDERGKPLHSAKPPQLQDALEEIHDGPRLELFARRQRLGWDTWGDEALCHVDLDAKASA